MFSYFSRKSRGKTVTKQSDALPAGIPEARDGTIRGVTRDKSRRYSREIKSFSDIDASVAATMMAATASRPTI
jgi:hypothetical protein